MTGLAAPQREGRRGPAPRRDTGRYGRIYFRKPRENERYIQIANKYDKHGVPRAGHRHWPAFDGERSARCIEGGGINIMGKNPSSREREIPESFLVDARCELR